MRRLQPEGASQSGAFFGGPAPPRTRSFKYAIAFFILEAPGWRYRSTEALALASTTRKYVVVPYGRTGAGDSYAATGSISVASSFGVRELLMRFETGHFCNTSSGAGLISAAASSAVPLVH